MKLIHWHIFSIDIPTQIPKILTTGFRYLNLQHFKKEIFNKIWRLSIIDFINNILNTKKPIFCNYSIRLGHTCLISPKWNEIKKKENTIPRFAERTLILLMFLYKHQMQVNWNIRLSTDTNDDWSSVKFSWKERKQQSIGLVHSCIQYWISCT